VSGIAFWITGLSGAGKTTVGKVLYEKIKAIKPNVVLLDGDMLRQVFGDDLGYTKEDRIKSANRNSRILNMLASQDIDTICCTICMFEDVRRWNRDNNERYVEVYLKVPMDVLKDRNQKNLYEEAQDEVVGLGVDMEEPQNPDLVIVNDGTKTPEEIADMIMEKAGYGT